MFEQRPNSGAIFNNGKKEKDSHPDMRGDFNIDGQKYSISGWWKTGKKGEFLSVSIQEWKAPELSKQVEVKPTRKQPVVTRDDFPNDEIPF
jgi:hypothetical protein